MDAVTCPTCGASAPVPGDLLAPTFPCPACGTALDTAQVVGTSVTAAEAFVRAAGDVLAGRASRIDVRPQDATAPPPRPSRCVRCGAAVEVPMALRVRELTCPDCHAVQPVAAHVSDAERLRVDLERQVAQNEALRALRSGGVACPRCSAHNDVPASGIDATCSFCGATLLLAGVVGEDAVARERLGRGVRALVDGARKAQADRERRTNLIVTGVVFGAIALVAAGLGLVSIVGAVAAALGLR